MPDHDQVRVGQIYAGVSGNRMLVIDVVGPRCQLTYQPNPGGEDPWWETSSEVADNMRLVRDA